MYILATFLQYLLWKWLLAYISRIHSIIDKKFIFNLCFSSKLKLCLSFWWYCSSLNYMSKMIFSNVIKEKYKKTISIKQTHFPFQATLICFPNTIQHTSWVQDICNCVTSSIPLSKVYSTSSIMVCKKRDWWFMKWLLNSSVSLWKKIKIWNFNSCWIPLEENILVLLGGCDLRHVWWNSFSKYSLKQLDVTYETIRVDKLLFMSRA